MKISYKKLTVYFHFELIIIAQVLNPIILFLAISELLITVTKTIEYNVFINNIDDHLNIQLELYKIRDRVR